MLTVNALTKRYGQLTVLDNAHLELTNGIYGFLAPNGTGKTTFLKILATLTAPTAGEVLWEGTEVRSLGASYRDILGYLPQDFGYYPGYSPRQFLQYLAALKDVDPALTDRRIDKLLSAVGLSSWADQKMRKFSGGMLRRTGIAQALLNDPKLLLLDEPTAGLDPMERSRLKELLWSLAKDRIIILSTHIVSDVEDLADRILILQNGRITDSTPQQLRDAYAGRILEHRLPPPEAAAFEEGRRILSRRQEAGAVVLRYLQSTPEDPGLPVPPSLDDVFLLTYQSLNERNDLL
ncbi:MAG: ATP-binding cassette domain-containing protein [Oscillospiraceae bacterium]|nr:ATP-binding cassette domain-containing protein [Oscillospiraceae bacterium]